MKDTGQVSPLSEATDTSSLAKRSPLSDRRMLRVSLYKGLTGRYTVTRWHLSRARDCLSPSKRMTSRLEESDELSLQPR